MHLWLILILLFGGLAHADRVTLDTPEALRPLTSQRLDWKITLIDIEAKKIIVKYRWLNPDGSSIALEGRAEETWVCRDIETPGDNTECTGADEPHLCCTGPGAGTCDGLIDNCFSSASPQIRSFQRTIFNQFRDAVLSPGNDGTVE